VLFDKICRENGITHRLTKIHSPTTTGKVERLQCATMRTVVSPVQPGGTRREVPGSDGLPGSER
jgi:transposase InsO family protein